jgi:hypothetical protein
LANTKNGFFVSLRAETRSEKARKAKFFVIQQSSAEMAEAWLFVLLLDFRGERHVTPDETAAHFFWRVSDERQGGNEGVRHIVRGEWKLGHGRRVRASRDPAGTD